jgi:hypothetical protein
MAPTAATETTVPNVTNTAIVSDPAPARLLTAGDTFVMDLNEAMVWFTAVSDVVDDILRNGPDCGVSAPLLMPDWWCTSLPDGKSSTCRLSRHRRICVQLSYPFATACTCRPWSRSIHAAGRSGFGVGGR